jgi:curved DNA-binding protein CbpA
MMLPGVAARWERSVNTSGGIFSRGLSHVVSKKLVVIAYQRRLDEGVLQQLKFQAVSATWEILMDPKKRAIYDTTGRLSETTMTTTRQPMLATNSPASTAARDRRISSNEK